MSSMRRELMCEATASSTVIHWSCARIQPKSRACKSGHCLAICSIACTLSQPLVVSPSERATSPGGRTEISCTNDGGHCTCNTGYAGTKCNECAYGWYMYNGKCNGKFPLFNICKDVIEVIIKILYNIIPIFLIKICNFILFPFLFFKLFLKKI